MVLVASVIAGALSLEHLAQNVAAINRGIPSDFWAELKSLGLLRTDAPVPDPLSRANVAGQVTKAASAADQRPNTFEQDSR